MVARKQLNQSLEIYNSKALSKNDRFTSLADFERHLISERTRAGLAAGRARGRMGGRPPALTPKQLREALLLLTDPEATITAIAGHYGVSRSTLYKSLRALADKAKVKAA